jgi:diguanylate cyclase (GGDEF)-like protein
VLTLFALFLLASGLTNPIDIWLLDLRSALLPAVRTPGVAIVEIDARSLREVGRWPWSRAEHARLLDRLREAGAGPIGYEVLFLEPDITSPEGDAQLSGAIRRHGVVVLPMTAEESSEGLLSETFPIEVLFDPASAVGHVDRTPDLRSGMFRGLHLFAGIGQARWPAMPLAMLAVGGDTWTRIGGGAGPHPGGENRWVRSNPVLPVFSQHLSEIPRFSAAAVLSGAFDPQVLKGLYVLVGVTAEGLGQRFSTIVSGQTTLLSGVELDALVLQSLLRNDWLQALDGWATATITAIVVLLAALFSVYPEARRILWKTLASVLVVLGLWVLLLDHHLWFPTMPALLALALVLGTRLWLRLQRTEIEAYRDHLTHVANRRRFGQVIEVEWRSALRWGKPLSLILLDVDQFKRYNDTYGHPAGDAALVEVGRALEGSTKRPRDLTARYGGEEFAVLLPETDATNAWVVAERIRAAVEALEIPHSGNPPFDILTVSLGIASLTPQAEESAKVLFRLADEALYAAKHSGRNRAEAAPAEPQGAAASATPG